MCRVLGLIANNTTEVSENTNLGEVMNTLTEMVRESFRNAKVKAAILPAFGEVLHLIASQEEVKGRSVDAWAVSAMTHTLITRCLQKGEEPIINHYVAKIIENISSTSGTHATVSALKINQST